MAKRRRSTSRIQRAQIVRYQPAPVTGSRGRRFARRAGSAAYESRHELYALAGAGALGFAERQNLPIPTIPMLGKVGTAAAICFAGSKLLKSQKLRRATTGLLAIAIYNLAKNGTIDG